MALTHASVHCRFSPYCCSKVLLSLRLYPWPFPGLVAKPASLAQHNCNKYTTRPFPMPHPRWECDPEPEALTQLTANQAQAFQMLRVQRKRRQWLQFKLHNFQHTPIHRDTSNGFKIGRKHHCIADCTVRDAISFLPKCISEDGVR